MASSTAAMARSIHADLEPPGSIWLSAYSPTSPKSKTAGASTIDRRSTAQGLIAASNFEFRPLAPHNATALRCAQTP
jgi:hypothetical protein